MDKVCGTINTRVKWNEFSETHLYRISSGQIFHLQSVKRV